MTFLLAIAGISGCLLAASAFDAALARRYPGYARTFEWLFGETPEPRIPEPRSHVRAVAHCPFCHGIPPYHDHGCGPLDRLDTPRPTETTR